MSTAGRVGQVFFRRAGKHTDGTELVMVMGVIPDDNRFFKEGHQYSVVVSPDGSMLSVIHGSEVDVTAKTRGLGADGVFTNLGWRKG